ncbi:MAG: host specificity protein J [Rhodoplanes sp.]|uniref:host specificity protein J n=1 Tax=Rhodoplanes sp. TaxID=1968906 RepID=UPI0017F5E5E9|nr:phage tail protein [Rhodoplanes sp.]NVO13913.1 host specificity protein J [Rhodoplanes sp.]
MEAPNTLRSVTYADALFVLGEGPLKAPDDLYRAVHLNDVPVKSSDGTMNFSNVTLTMTLGTPSQGYLPGTPAAETTLTIGTKVTQGAPLVHAITDLSATAGRVIMTIAALVSVNSTNGNSNPTNVEFAIDVQPFGGSYSQVVYDNIYGKCISPAQREYPFPLPGTGPWNVRVRRITADSDSSNLLNEIDWSSLATLRDYRLSYPNTAILHVRVSAEQFSGSFPAVKYLGPGLILEIPSNYNPATRAYSGIWDGTFTTGWTTNPAWVIWGLLTHKRWGLGSYIGPEATDKWSLYQLAQWCDELVPDGQGGTEPRYAFNGTFESAVDAYKAITLLSGAVQSMSYWSSGAASIVIDRPVDPVKQVAPANVVDGKFIYEGSDIAVRPTAVHVTWNDPDNGYQKAVEAVEYPDLIQQYGLRIKQVVAVLCTSRGQAIRTGTYEIETEWSEGQVVNWVAGEDHHDLMPGDLVDVADPSIQARRIGGRLMSAAATTVVLDSPVTIEPGQSYVLRVPGADGVLQSRAVLNTASTTDTLTILSAFSPEPVPGAVWQLVASDLAPQRFRVLGVEEKDNGTYSISALSHDPNKQARIEGGTIIDLPSITAYHTGPIERPTGLSYTETIEQLAAGAYRHTVTLGWDSHPDARVNRFDVQYQMTGDVDWTLAGAAYGLTANLYEIGSGSYSFRIRAVAFDGKVSPWTDPFIASLSGLLDPPPDITGMAISVLDTTAALSWDPVRVANFSHYEVRFASDPATVLWQSMVPMAQNVISSFVQVAARTGVYAVKAYTAQDKESINPALVVSNIDGTNINVVETLVGNPGWSGELSNVIIDDTRQAIRLGAAADLFDWTDLFSRTDLFGDPRVRSAGAFTWARTIDLGAVFTCRISADLSVFGENTAADIWSEPDLYELPTVWGADPRGWDAWVEIRTTTDDPSSLSAVWTDWARLVVADRKMRGLQARYQLSTTDQTVTPIAKGSVTVDMPDRVDSKASIMVPIGGVRVSFNAAFNGPARPSVVITGIEGAGAGDWPNVTSVDTTGFNVTVMNGTSAVSGRSIDYHAKGYGALAP